jgi:hypothetical protein
VFDGEVSRAWCAFVEGLEASQSVAGVAEQVDFDGVEPDIFFPGRGETRAAERVICAECAVRRECLETALANREELGIFGGTSEKERRQLRRRPAQRRAACWSRLGHGRTENDRK